MPRRSIASSRATLAILLLCATRLHAAPALQADNLYPNTGSFGVAFATDEHWYRQCMRVAQLPALPQPSARAQPVSCKATDLYYLRRDQKRTSAAEWRQVHACAQASGDDAVLMMLYANGYGQRRDPDRALQHACKLDSAKAEMEGRVSYLASARNQGDGQAFDLCDHATSGYMGSVCAGLRDTREERLRIARLDHFAGSLPARARKPFTHLRKAADVFARQSATEVDLSGTAGAGFALDHAARRRDEFVEAVFDAAAGKIAHVTADEFARLDAQLNAVYRKLMAMPPEPGAAAARIGNSTVARADVRVAERAWLAYRDAWAPYLAASGAPIDHMSIKAMLTRQRIAQLSRI